MASSSEADAKRCADVRTTSGTADVQATEQFGTDAQDDVFGGMKVGQLLGAGDVGKRVRPHDVIGDVAEILAASGRTAMAVVNEDDELNGMVTVNDVMRAFFDGVPSDKRLTDWLESGAARAPHALLQRLVVRPSSTLKEAAEKMVENAVAGDCACHHAVVQEEQGRVHGVISSHDVVKALCCHELNPRQHVAHPDMFSAPDAAESAQTMKVRNVMKHRENVFTCLPSDTMKDALKILLVTQQNSVLVVVEAGVYGLVTPRDAVKAFADGVSNSIPISEWWQERPAVLDARMIPSDAELVDAAKLMTEQDVDHLIVVHPRGGDAVGVLSSLDMLLRTRAHSPVLRNAFLWSGPTVGQCLERNQQLRNICKLGTTLAEVAEMLVTSGRTSTIVQMGADEGQLGLLTENDILRAYVDGWARNTPVTSLLTSTEFQHATVPWNLQVPPSMPMLEAAQLMLHVAEPGRTCHHLVVKAVTGEWLGVFSALDVARALDALASDLDIARTGADQTTVGMVMKPEAVVTTCKTTDTIRDALASLDTFGQNAALVIEKTHVHGLITPRCALQAMAEGIPQDRSVADWLQNRRMPEGPREVLRSTRLVDAAGIMTSHSLHHLLVVDIPNAEPVGVLSSLDLARGVVSINYQTPFVTLAWLRMFGESTTFAMQAPRSSAQPNSSSKRPVSGDANVADEPARAGCRPRTDQ